MKEDRSKPDVQQICEKYKCVHNGQCGKKKARPTLTEEPEVYL